MSKLETCLLVSLPPITYSPLLPQTKLSRIFQTGSPALPLLGPPITSLLHLFCPAPQPPQHVGGIHLLQHWPD